MGTLAAPSLRVFKTSWFTKAARKAHIRDEELCSAIAQVELGQADDLGGGVYKKRLGKNQYRSIIVTKVRTFWVYQSLFAKQDQANIDNEELAFYRKLAKTYGEFTSAELSQLLREQRWKEICNGDKT